MAYEEFVLNGTGARTKAFYGDDFQTGVFGDKSFRPSVYDDRECHEVANRLTEVIDGLPEIEAIVAVITEVSSALQRSNLTNESINQSDLVFR